MVFTTGCKDDPETEGPGTDPGPGPGPVENLPPGTFSFAPNQVAGSP